MTTPVRPARDFPIGVVLTLAAGSYDRPFCELRDLYEVLGHMLGTVPSADQLHGAIAACRASVLRQHPALVDIPVPGPDVDDTTVLAWLASQEQQHGAMLPLSSMQAGARG